jgi:1-pyrroline-5-carboxylate dehydrogenase
MEAYRNEPYADFDKDENRRAFMAALEEVRGEFGQTYPLIIGGEEIYLDDTFPSTNPNRPKEVLGYVANGNASHAQRALEVAAEAFKTWQYTPVRERAEYLFEAARRMRERKHYYSAWMVYEVGKSWAEADELLRAPDDTPGRERDRTVGALRAGRKRVDVHSARRRRGDSALELP